MPTRATRIQSKAYRPRASAAARGYGRAWQRASKGYLAKHPLCAECERRGRTTEAVLVDHIVPHRGDQVIFWRRANWQGLCIPCHAIKTAQGL